MSMELLGKRDQSVESEDSDAPERLHHDHESKLLQEPNNPLPGDNPGKMAASSSGVGQTLEPPNPPVKVFPRERNPLMLDTFENCLQFRYRKSRIDEMTHYLAPFVSLENEAKARHMLNKNPLIPKAGQARPANHPQMKGLKERTNHTKHSQQKDCNGNLLLRAENELEYLESAYDFLEGYLREESPEDLEELSQLSEIPLSELQLWLDNKLDLVKALRDIQRRF
jgi:hypothetical protein